MNNEKKDIQDTNNKTIIAYFLQNAYYTPCHPNKKWYTRLRNTKRFEKQQTKKN